MHTAQKFELNGMEMYCEVRGDGEPLVLLHGGTGAGSDWRYVFDESLEGYRTIVPDLRSHGRSTNPSGTLTFRQVASDVLALMDRLGVERFKAIGMSLGAKALLHVATAQPARVDAMVLVSATPYFPPQARAIMAQTNADTLTEAEWKVLRQKHVHGDEQIRALHAQLRALKDSYDDMNFTPPYLSTITARTLIVHGDRDPLYPVNLAIEMYTAIPRAALWIVPNGGHVPLFGPMAPRFRETALEFLRAG
ncbi:alpha/beta fold hydrolase [Archangium lansingense]|uniref:Alpha/beta fold hydrolase n=1 Tax=Archangium lansingense TaxID=2995310 RepID=A0ABT4AN28_9BACT|nr:alpha/beta fold hydrolase [Archangium lansinium]MCY1082254.1 alpha/beta fold hydrolase [Archangium lansinium]